MKILSVDSSAQIATVALLEDGALLAEYSLNNGNTHSETLLPMVETILRDYRVSVSDIDLFACSSGPGSFTGVRIGAATVKGLAFAQNKPCIGVSTLEAIAENLSVCRGLICPVMNARRSQVYTALFRSDGKTLTISVAGDIDGNGDITAADARLALRAAVGLDKLSSAQTNASEIDKNSKITAADARLILRASVGLEDTKSWIKK